MYSCNCWIKLSPFFSYVNFYPRSRQSSWKSRKFWREVRMDLVLRSEIYFSITKYMGIQWMGNRERVVLWTVQFRVVGCMRTVYRHIDFLLFLIVYGYKNQVDSNLSIGDCNSRRKYVGVLRWSVRWVRWEDLLKYGGGGRSEILILTKDKVTLLFLLGYSVICLRVV